MEVTCVLNDASGQFHPDFCVIGELDRWQGKLGVTERLT